MKSKSLDTEQQIIDTMMDSYGTESEKEESKSDVFKDKEEPESFLSFRFQRYEEFIDGVKGSNGEFTNSKPLEVVEDHEADSLSGSSSDDEFYEPSYDPPILEDSDGSLCDGDDPRVCSNAASLQVDDEFRVPKDVKSFADEDNGFELLLGSDLESVVSSSNFSLRSSLLDSIKDGYLSSSSSDDDDDDGDDKDKIDVSMLKGKPNNRLSQEEAEFQELSRGYEPDDVEEDEDLLAELKGIEADVAKDQQVDEEDGLDWEESSGMETQWEHQDLIEQLRVDIGKVKAIGLPTIFEDSEPPKMAEDLKPWKIDEKLFRTSGGTMDEVHKFYKSYRERMRKFDIFNYQKMYAIVEGSAAILFATKDIASNDRFTGLLALQAKNVGYEQQLFSAEVNKRVRERLGDGLRWSVVPFVGVPSLGVREGPSSVGFRPT